MSYMLSDRSLLRIRWATSIIFLGLFAYYVADSLRWTLIWDAPVMRYTYFLVTRGMHPYTEIPDINMPGCYVLEGWAIAIFGWSDLSWRIYEFFLLAILTLGGMIIGGSRRWFAGIFAATFFIAMHGSEGPNTAVQREEVMLVLLVAATAMFFLAMRHLAPILMLPFGLLAGLAVSLKPGSLLLDIALLAMASILILLRKQCAGRYLLWGLAGNLAIALLMAGFLWQHHAVHGFLFIVRTVWPAYSRTRYAGIRYLLRHLMPIALMPLAALGLVAAILRRGKVEWERWALFLAMAIGAFSYFAQGKGTTYQRYMFVLFLALWIGWELSEAMNRSETRLRVVGVAGTAALFLVVVPYYVALMHHNAPEEQLRGQLTFSLDRDLAQLGGDELQQQVQCLDVVNGCINALYRMRLVQNTGVTGDILLFAPESSPAVEYYRNWFMAHQQTHPANVIVLGNEWYQSKTVSFDKINTWPLFASYLRTMYVPVIERHYDSDAGSPAYRIYLRKGSAVLADEESNPLHP